MLKTGNILTLYVEIQANYKVVVRVDSTLGIEQQVREFIFSSFRDFSFSQDNLEQKQEGSRFSSGNFTLKIGEILERGKIKNSRQLAIGHFLTQNTPLVGTFCWHRK